MLRWSKFSLKSKKAQFFIISTVIVAVALASISGMFRVYSSTDVSQVTEFNGGDVFSDVKEDIKSTIDSSSDCEDRERNLREFKEFTEGKALREGVGLNITYYSFCPATVSLELKSQNMVIRDEFTYP